MRPTPLLTLAALLPRAAAFAPPRVRPIARRGPSPRDYVGATTAVFSTPDGEGAAGGFTAKQRLREEVESPFRKVRLAFFATSSASAALALYFSATSALKAYLGGFPDAPPLEEALLNCGINAAGAAGLGALAVREVKVGKANLERIAKGGLLARLVVRPAAPDAAPRTLKDYRRNSRVVIAAGGADYVNRLCLSLCSDQLADENTLPAALRDIDMVVVPVLLDEDARVADAAAAWRDATAGPDDRNFDSARADEIVAFPEVTRMWNEYLRSDVETARGQGFDVLANGITITVKKNGRILRRATGLPPYGDFLGMMEVADGSRFGMPGDSEKYGGP